VFLRHGITTIDDLATIDVAALTGAGLPSDGLDRMRLQAKALLAGRVLPYGRPGLPRGVKREFFLRIETDPSRPR
jgi:predicted RecB family nuclease